MRITDVSKLKGPLGELHDQLFGDNGEERLAEFNLWLKKVVTGVFKYDKRKDGWTLLENIPRRISSAIDAVPFFKNGESSVNGDVMATRAVELDANYGQEDAEWLLEHQNLIPKELRNFYLVFPATNWRDLDGGRRVPFLGWGGHRWLLGFDWLDGGFGDRARLVRPRK